MIQKEFVGLGSIEKLTHILENENVKTALLITGNKSFLTSGAEKTLLKFLKNVTIERYSNFEVNPKLKDMANKRFEEEMKCTLREEVTQMLGLTHDSYKYPNSIFQEAKYFPVTQYSQIDKEIIKMLYN